MIFNTTYNNIPVSLNTRTNVLNLGFIKYQLGVLPDITSEDMVKTLTKNTLSDLGFNENGVGEFILDDHDNTDMPSSLFNYKNGQPGWFPSDPEFNIEDYEIDDNPYVSKHETGMEMKDQMDKLKKGDTFYLRLIWSGPVWDIEINR